MHRHRAGEIAFIYQGNKRNELVTLVSVIVIYTVIVIYIILENRCKRLHYLENQAFSALNLRQWFRLHAISHFHWSSNSEVFVDVWLCPEKSIGEFSMVYKKKWVLWYGLGSIIMINRHVSSSTLQGLFRAFWIRFSLSVSCASCDMQISCVP